MREYPKIAILSLALSIFPLVLLAGIFLYNTQKELKSEIYDRLNAVSQLKKNKLETFINSRKEDLNAIQGFLDVKINLPTLEGFDRDRYNFAYTKARVQLDDQLRGFMNTYAYADILLLNVKGRIIFVANPAHARQYLDRTVFNKEVLRKAQGGIYVSGPVATKEWRYPYVLYMVLQAHDTQDQFCGYIVLQVDMKTVYDVIADNTGLGVTGETFLVKRTGVDSFNYISPLLFDPKAIFIKPLAGIDPMSKTISQGIDYRGHQVLALSQDIPSLQWFLITKINKQEVLAPVSNTRTLFLTVCLLTVVLLILGCLLFTEGILKQLRNLQTMTIQDPLTGVLNRRGFQEILLKTCGMVLRMGIRVHVLLLDLDNFKQINDRHGHGVGDAVLVAVTDKIRRTVRQTDYVARVGGDEFVVLLMDSRENDAIKVADKIRMAVAQTSAGHYFGKEVRVTCSIGVMLLNGEAVSIDELIQRLHDSLLTCKNKGKNQVAYQSAKMAGNSYT